MGIKEWVAPVAKPVAKEWVPKNGWPPLPAPVAVFGCREWVASVARSVARLPPLLPASVALALVLALLWFLTAAVTGSTPLWIAATFFADFVVIRFCLAPKVRRIDLDENDILLSSSFRTLRLRLSSLVAVTERPGGGFHWATIEFDHEIPFGRHVHSIPIICYERIGHCRWRRIAPVVEELATIASARCTREGRPTAHG